MDLGILTIALEEIQRLSTTLMGGLGGDARSGLRWLFGLTYSWAIILWIISGRPVVPAAYVSMLVKLFVVAWLLSIFPTVVPALFEAAAGTGASLTGTGILTLDDPGGIAMMGPGVAEPFWRAIVAMSGWSEIAGNLIPIALMFGAWLAVTLMFAIIGVMLFVFQAEFWMLLPFSMLTVVFGVFGPTAYLAQRGIGYVVSSMLRIMVVGGIAAGLTFLVRSLTIPADPSVLFAFGVLVLCVTVTWLAWKVPSLFGGLMSGGPVLGAGHALADMVGSWRGAAMVGRGASRTAATLGRVGAGTLGVAGVAAVTLAGMARSRFAGGNGGERAASRASAGAVNGAGGTARAETATGGAADTTWRSRTSEQQQRTAEGRGAAGDTAASPAEDAMKRAGMTPSPQTGNRQGKA